VHAVRYAVALSAWALVGYVSLWVAANTQIGPTVAVLSPTHGVHEGDVIVLLAGVAVASLVSLVVLGSPRD
jgi:hypothetical protein